MILEFYLARFSDDYRIVFDDGTTLKASYRNPDDALRAAMHHIGDIPENWKRAGNCYTRLPMTFIVLPVQTSKDGIKYCVQFQTGEMLPDAYPSENAAALAACKKVKVCREMYYRDPYAEGGPVQYLRLKTYGPKIVLVTPQTIKTEPLNRFWLHGERTPEMPVWVAPISPLQYCEEVPGGWGLVTLRIQDDVITGDLGGYQIFTRELHLWDQIP